MAAPSDNVNLTTTPDDGSENKLDGQALLARAVQILSTPAGAVLLGEKIDIIGLTNRLTELASKYDIDVEYLEKATTKEIASITDTTDLTKEQKRENKQEARLSTREKLQKRKDQVISGAVDNFNKAKAEYEELKLKIKSEIPALESYTFTGRIQDTITNTPLKGVRVQLGANPLDKPLPTFDAIDSLVNLRSEGILIPPEILPGNIDINPNNFVYVPVVGSTITRTDKDGNYSLEIKIPIIPKNQKTPLPLALLFTAPGFIPGTKVILNGDSTIKTDLGLSGIVNIEAAAKQVQQEFSDGIDKAQRFVQRLAQTLPEQAISAKKLAIHRILEAVKTKMLPLVVGLLFAFGISKVSQSNRKTCPTGGGLLDVVQTRNKVVRQLNQIFKTIVSNTAFAAAFIALAAVLKGVRLSTDALPAPQATGIFPAKDFGGLISALPYSFTGKVQRLKDTFAELEVENEKLNKAILTNLVFLIAAATTVTLLLKAIDNMTQECAEEGGVEDLELTAINQELLDLAEEEAEDGNPIIGNVNGFIFSVETDNQNPVGTLKRRFAVAKDSRGITVLKGEPSFSSSDQILIDELVFYIQQNDLKAF